MIQGMRCAAGVAALAIVAIEFSGCAALSPERSLRSTMTLAPGQAVRGQFQIPDGSRGLVQFQRENGKTGVPPYPEATTWTGDRAVLIAFPEDTKLPGELALGFASQWIEDGRTLQVVVRNTSARPATFDWIVTGPSDAVATWDVSGAATAVR